jgi:hypothetical protein
LLHRLDFGQQKIQELGQVQVIHTKTLSQKPLIQHLTKVFNDEDLQLKSRDESAQFCDDRVVTVTETISKLF